MTTNNDSWKKTAADKIAAAGPVDKAALEKAFMDQAYGYVANKAAQLFRDPYRLGFETVFKNEAMTRMVGLFAFRIGNRLLYAPVFFINGLIKGHDLLYRHWVKKFCPNTEAWVSFLIEGSENGIGTNIDRADAGRFRSAIRWDAVAHPPAYKSAADLNAAWDQLLDEMSEQIPARENILGDFMSKHASEGVFDRLADMIDSSLHFADAIARLPETSWCPEPPKMASANEPVTTSPELFRFCPADATPEEFAKFAAQGYLLRDKRAAADITDVFSAQLPDVGTGVPGPGKHRMLMADGGWREVLAGWLGNDFNGCDSPCAGGGCGGPHTPPLVLVDLDSGDSKHFYRHADCVLDESDGEETPLSELGSDKPTSGRAWRVLDAQKGQLSRPLYVQKVETRDGITTISANSYCIGGKPNVVLRLNPDLPDCDFYANQLGVCARFIPVSSIKEERCFSCPETKAEPASVKQLDRLLLDNNELQQISLSKDAYGEFKLASAGKVECFDETELLHRLMTLGLSEKRAGEMIAKTTSPTRWVIKRAYATRVIGRENFNNGSSATFGVETDQPRQALLPTHTQQVRHASPQIGDAWDPSMGHGGNRKTSDPIPTELVLTLSPEELANVANTRNLPNVFEHGVIGSMVKTYDSLAMLEGWIPDLETCIDRLGRALFLFYFKPSDFEKAYGTDDMQTQENDFLNAFKTLGDLTLQLLKRRRAGGGETGMESSGSSVQMLD